MAYKIRIDENEEKEELKKNSKWNNKNTILTMIGVIILVGVFIGAFISFNNEKKDDLKDDKKEPINLQDLVPEDCTFVKSYNVKKIKITAESSAGVGDVYSKTIAKDKYLIKNNNIGDIYDVNYKYNGDESRYECNEDWYSITLSDGSEGYIWGGYKSMYVEVIE